MTNDGNQPPQPPANPPEYPVNPPQYSEQYSYQQPSMQVGPDGYPVGYPAPKKKGFPLWIPLLIVAIALIGVAVWLFVTKGSELNENTAPPAESHEILDETDLSWADYDELTIEDGWGLWITTSENCSISQLKVGIYEDQDTFFPVKTLQVDSGSLIAGTEKLVEFTEPDGYQWAIPLELWCSN